MTAAEKRVLHVAHYSQPHIGGIETVVHSETVLLATRGWDVTLLTSTWGAAVEDSKDSGVRILRVRAWNGIDTRFGVPFPIFSPRLLVTMFREVRRADVVHMHDALYMSSWVAAFCCLILRTPYVVHRHVGFVHHSSWLVRAVQRFVLATFARMVFQHSDAILPIDNNIAEGIRSVLPRSARVKVIGNGVDAAFFRPAGPGERDRLRQDLGLPADQVLALFVGRFVPKKGFDHVAAAVSDDYGLVFVGGDRPPGLTDERLHFLGGRPAAEMPDIYRSADVMIVASVGECPLTVLEAMSSGLPVLANDDPALHSPWTSGPGVQFVDMAAGDLRGALEHLVADAALIARTGEEAHHFVETAFSWDAHVDQLESVYDEIRKT